jgi:hypothetical protein
MMSKGESPPSIPSKVPLRISVTLSGMDEAYFPVTTVPAMLTDGAGWPDALFRISKVTTYSVVAVILDGLIKTTRLPLSCTH